MSLKGTLTNEKLTKRFGNPFELVRHAIEMADHAVAHGEGMEMHLATDILEDIAAGTDQVEVQEINGQE